MYDSEMFHNVIDHSALHSVDSIQHSD